MGSAAARASPPRSFRLTNFDYIRVAAAAAVIFSHSFLIAEGSEANEPFERLLGPHNILGLYAVLVFFVMSGFLVTLSAVQSRGPMAFAWKRFLRIFPAYFVCLLLTGTIFGLIYSNLPTWDFLKHAAPLKYAVGGALFVVSPETMPILRFYPEGPDWLAEMINGSLWTIPLEVACYVGAGLLLAGRSLRWPIVALLLVLALPFMFADPTLPFGRAGVLRAAENAILVAPSFIAGSLVYFLWARSPVLPRWPLLVCAVFLVLALVLGRTLQIFPLFAAYPLLYLATGQVWRWPSLSGFGDISYGLYLYGWPVEQVVRATLGPGVPWWAVFVLSLAIAGTLGYVSWHLLEKHALALKRRKTAPALSAASSGKQ